MDDALEPALNAFAITFADRMSESETTLTNDAAYAVDLADHPLTLWCVGGSLVMVLREGLRRWSGLPREPNAQCRSLCHWSWQRSRAAGPLRAGREKADRRIRAGDPRVPAVPLEHSGNGSAKAQAAERASC